jgi:menaquinol-cytochrome c reductase iron-sulfur subunit
MRSLLKLLTSSLGWLWVSRRYTKAPPSSWRGAAPNVESPAPVVVKDSPASDPKGYSRRAFFAKASVAFTGLVAAAASVPALGVILSPVTRRVEHTWHPVGAIDDFEINETVRVIYRDPAAQPWAGPTADSAAWLRRMTERDFVAFSVYCTHTGCPVAWTAGANLFLCPCHGGVFDRDGRVVAGPPEEPLVRLDVRVRDGQVELYSLGVPVTGDRPEGRSRARRTS